MTEPSQFTTWFLTPPSVLRTPGKRNGPRVKVKRSIPADTLKTPITKVALAAGVLLLLVTGYVFFKKSRAPDVADPRPAAAPSAVACLGRIIPEDDIIHLNTPASSYPGPPPLAEIRVKEGDRVTQGQVIAVLENKERLETSWHAAEGQARVAESRVAQAKEAAKASDIASQASEVGRLTSEVAAAKIDYDRSLALHKASAISDSEFDQSRLALETRRQSLESAQARLRSLAEVRQIDVQVAEAELESARAEASHAKAELTQAIIRSPVNGQVIKILAWPGEHVGPEGFAELAKTDRMYVMAEVYETDIGRVKVGQGAEISGFALRQKVRGTVEQIGLKVGKNSVFNPDPASQTDSRVVEVKILIADPAAVAGLIHARVNVLIETGTR